MPGQADRRQIRAPYLIGLHNLHLFDQVGIAPIAMLTVGRAVLSAHLHQQVLLLHQSLHSFTVDLPPYSLELLSQSPRAVARMLDRNCFQCRTEVECVVLVRLIVIRARRQIDHLTEQLDGIVCRQRPHDFSPLVEREGSSLEAFFEASNSIVSRPTIRSNSAIRSCSPVAFPLLRGSVKA